MISHLVLESLDKHVASLALEVIVGHIQATKVGQRGDGLHGGNGKVVTPTKTHK